MDSGTLERRVIAVKESLRGLGNREAARVMRVVSEDLEVPLVPGGTADDLAAQLAAALQGTVDNLEQWNRETRGYLELYRALREVRR
jgi:hypothetical protein